MSTREENLKKINNVLEQLSDEELEKVAGGNSIELDEVVKALRANKKIGFPEGEYLFGSPERQALFAEQKLAQLGINAKMNLGLWGSTIGENDAVYTDKVTGKSLTHAEVMNIIKNYKG